MLVVYSKATKVPVFFATRGLMMVLLLDHGLFRKSRTEHLSTE